MKRVFQRNRRNGTPESLEQRALLTPIIVTSLADNTIDDNETTLREAVEEARNDPFGYADIAFAPGLSPDNSRSVKEKAAFVRRSVC